MTPNRLIRITPFLALLLAVFAVAGCGDDKNTSASAGNSDNKLVIYSGREAKLVEPLYKKFEKDTGIKVEVRHAESPELAATILEEGDNARADVFYAQDAGSIGSIDNQLAPLPQDQLDKVPAKYRDDQGRWTGITGRVRVLAYNTDTLKEADLPDSVLDLTDPKWKGKLGIAPGNASFQAFVTAMRVKLGGDTAKKWLEGIKANDVQTFENNGAITEAVSKGEIDAGLVNHYYLYELKSENPNAPVANHYFKSGDIGSLVNVSAAGILKTAPNTANAERFIEYLLSNGQEFFATEAEEKEYPLVKGYENKLPKDLKPLDEVRGPEVNLSTFGKELPDTVRLIESVGFTGT